MDIDAMTPLFETSARASPQIVQSLIRRWEQLTGKQATLLASGMIFEDVSAERQKEPSI